MTQTEGTKHIPASPSQIAEAVKTLMRALELHPDAPVVPRVTDRPGCKELLIEDLSDAIKAKTPSTFTLNNTVQILLTHCDYFPHRDEILQLLDCGSDKIKKG